MGDRDGIRPAARFFAAHRPRPGGGPGDRWHDRGELDEYVPGRPISQPAGYLAAHVPALRLREPRHLGAAVAVRARDVARHTRAGGPLDRTADRGRAARRRTGAYRREGPRL